MPRDDRGVECVARKYGIGAISTDEVTAGGFPSFSTEGYEAFTVNEYAEIRQAVASIFSHPGPVGSIVSTSK
ncbi:hypothetical protein A15U_04141 [Escherichia coli KTE210]|nr:hypothetical protein A15U_04141 [Escherichia coli KTE210]